jgi:glycosyltransferase involved in cell wall biosynthesis
MRILHIGKYYPPVAGGMERFLGDLVDEQRSAGHEVTVLVHAEPGARALADPPWLMRCPTWMRLAFVPISPTFPFWLARAIRRFRPDVLHLHMPNASAFWALLLPAARRIPWIVHWQSDVEASRFKLSLRLGYPHYRIFERALLEQSAAIVVASPQYLAGSKPLEPWRHKCQVIPLGVAQQRLPEVADAADSRWWSGSRLRVLAAGRLSYYKGFDTLVRAVAGDDRLECVIAGDGEERRLLEREIARSGAGDRIRLAGSVDDATLCQLMASCDVFCLPSRERTEAFGLVLVEAMRYAKPLVTSNLPASGVNWVARAGQNALLVPPDDVASLRGALQALASHPAQRALLGRLGYERFLREFGIVTVARRIEQLYAITLRMASEDAAAAHGQVPEDANGESEDAVRGHSERLLVVIPALNEAACIASVVAQARCHPRVDVVVIDDGSTDDTAPIAIINGATVLRAPLWQGAWGAIQTGIRYAVRKGYSAVVTMDADGQHEPLYLPALIDAGRDADVVIAACPSRGSRLRHIAWGYFRLITGFNLDDLTSGFRYYGARACRLLCLEDATLLDYQDIGVLLLLRHAGLKISEIPVAMNPRRSGASRVFFSWGTVARYMLETSLLCLARWAPRRGTVRAR